MEDLQFEGLKIIQADGGYKFSTDSVLLANFGSAKQNDVYVDLCRNVLDDRESTHISLSSGSVFSTFDAGYAMGISTDESYKKYLAEMDALKERVEEKLKREGLRRL